jgi:hypothetical protein
VEIVTFGKILSTISRPYFHLPLLGLLAPLQTLGPLVAKVGTL